MAGPGCCCVIAGAGGEERNGTWLQITTVTATPLVMAALAVKTDRQSRGKTAKGHPRRVIDLYDSVSARKTPVGEGKSTIVGHFRPTRTIAVRGVLGQASQSSFPFTNNPYSSWF